MVWLEREGFIIIDPPKMKRTKRRPAKVREEESEYMPSESTRPETDLK
jgi:hypothetical protein